MAAHIADTEQGAFTWTGPYGGGKSSLALALACLFGAPKPVREQAASLFGEDVFCALKASLPYFPSRWDVLPLVTERRSIAEQLAEALNIPDSSSSSEILKEIETRTKARGLLVIMDELGRGLESAADGDGDLHILQDIAELAARSQGRVIFLGVLHQAFEEYAERLGRKSKDAWAKIQGRFVDISVAVSLDETIELIGDALGHKRAVRSAIPLAERCVEQLRPTRKKTEAKRLAGKLARAAPLHPLTACLIGPMSRRRFGQNQRSVFSFLISAEPYGLQDALASEVTKGLYPPHLLWDYLETNLDAAILSSPDGRRWAMAHDVMERSAARHATDAELLVLKTIAILELLKDRSGLVASIDTIKLALEGICDEQVAGALGKLEKRSEIVFRKHAGMYALFAGSDFDVDARLEGVLSEKVDLDLNLVRTLADLQPMLAKRHYEETGSMRWYEMSIEPVSELDNLTAPKKAQDTVGRVVFALPTDGETQEEAVHLQERVASASRAFPLVIGHHADARKLLDLAHELSALRCLDERFPELQGDPVARREIEGRATEVRRRLEEKLYSQISECTWYEAGHQPRRLTKRQLNERLSFLAHSLFSDAPLIRNELLNCSEPSSNAVSARTKLMKRMALRADSADLGFGGNRYPAERGLYISLLKETGIHSEGVYRAPIEGDLLFPLWREADCLLGSAEHSVVTAKEIIQAWQGPPIGLKSGLGPVFVVAYILSRRDSVAIYGEGVFQSRFNELCVEFLARDLSDIGVRHVQMEGFVGDTLKALGDLLKLDSAEEPLLVAQEIISEFDSLVSWTNRTQSLSPQTLRVRDVLKRASDPNKLLFDDLPSLTKPLPGGGFDAHATAVLLRDALAEMRAAYPSALGGLKALMIRELDVRSSDAKGYKHLRERADNVRQVGGDLRMEAFVGRLAQFHGTQDDMESLAGVAVNKFPRDWNDGDWERAAVELTGLAISFLKAETMARVKGRKDRRQALAVVVGADNMPHSLFREFEVADVDRSGIENLAKSLDRVLAESDHERREVILAALVEVTAKYLEVGDERQLGALA